MNWRSLAALFQVGIVLIWEFQTMIPPEQIHWSPTSAEALVSATAEATPLRMATRDTTCSSAPCLLSRPWRRGHVSTKLTAPASALLTTSTRFRDSWRARRRLA